MLAYRVRRDFDAGARTLRVGEYLGSEEFAGMRNGRALLRTGYLVIEERAAGGDVPAGTDAGPEPAKTKGKRT